MDVGRNRLSEMNLIFCKCAWKFLAWYNLVASFCTSISNVCFFSLGNFWLKNNCFCVTTRILSISCIRFVLLLVFSFVAIACLVSHYFYMSSLNHPFPFLFHLLLLFPLWRALPSSCTPTKMKTSLYSIEVPNDDVFVETLWLSNLVLRFFF